MQLRTRMRLKMCRLMEMFPVGISPLQRLLPATSPNILIFAHSLPLTASPPTKWSTLCSLSQRTTPKPMQCNIVTFLDGCVPALVDNLGQKGPRALSIRKVSSRQRSRREPIDDFDLTPE